MNVYTGASATTAERTPRSHGSALTASSWQHRPIQRSTHPPDDKSSHSLHKRVVWHTFIHSRCYSPSTTSRQTWSHVDAGYCLPAPHHFQIRPTMSQHVALGDSGPQAQITLQMLRLSPGSSRARNVDDTGRGLKDLVAILSGPPSYRHMLLTRKDSLCCMQSLSTNPCCD